MTPSRAGCPLCDASVPHVGCPRVTTGTQPQTEYQQLDDEFGEPITCDEFVDDGRTRRCARCGWWRTTHG